MTVSCWAECLGDCSDKQSEEHTVSENIFKGEEVSVRGFPWCKDMAKRLPMRKLVANILCTEHNSELSPVDAAGGQVFRSLREAWALHEVRARLKPDYRKIHHYRIDGFMLERWFLKTAINVWFPYRGNTAFGRAGSPTAQLATEFVEAAFGRRSLSDPMGLYWVGYVGQPARLVEGTSEHVSIATSLGQETGADGQIREYVVGVAFSFQGCRFLLWVDSNQDPSTLAGCGFSDEEWEYSGWMRHINEIGLKEGKYPSQVITIDWSGSDRLQR